MGLQRAQLAVPCCKELPIVPITRRIELNRRRIASTVRAILKSRKEGSNQKRARSRYGFTSRPTASRIIAVTRYSTLAEPWETKTADDIGANSSPSAGKSV